MTKSKFSNEEKERRYKIRKVLRVLIMIFATATIVLAVLCLAIKLSFVYPLLTYVITAILTYIRNRYDFHDVEEKIELQKKVDEEVTKKSSPKNSKAKPKKKKSSKNKKQSS